MKSSKIKKLLLDTFGHLNDKQLLALTIYGEARGERPIGQIAVGSVILERVDHRDWDGKTIQEVCLMPYQFSCYLPEDPNFPKLKAIAENWDAAIDQTSSLHHCYRIAAGLLDGVIPRDMVIAKFNATQYVTAAYRSMMDRKADELRDAESPMGKLAIFDKKRWWIRMRKVTTIGAHEFYA